MGGFFLAGVSHPECAQSIIKIGGTRFCNYHPDLFGKRFGLYASAQVIVVNKVVVFFKAKLSLLTAIFVNAMTAVAPQDNVVSGSAVSPTVGKRSMV
jgi:hypothetical protein